MRTFTTIIDMDTFFNKACETALQNVAKIVRDKLEESISEDFYKMYKPKFYTRTYEFLKSPKFELLNTDTAKVFIDDSVMNYLGISGKEVAELATYGFHGSIDIYRPGFYWTDFIEWCDENVPLLFKQEFKKQGINTI